MWRREGYYFFYFPSHLTSPSSNIHLFVNDCKIFRKETTANDTVLLRQGIFEIEDWCTTSDMNLNPLKSSTLAVSLKKKEKIVSITSGSKNLILDTDIV